MKTPILLLALFLFGASASADGGGKKVLMIFSSGAPMGETTARNNLWEYAEPHHVFVMHGYVVDFVSPKGGRVPFSLDVDQADPPGMVSYTMKYEGFRQKADRTLAPEQITRTTTSRCTWAAEAGRCSTWRTISGCWQSSLASTKKVASSVRMGTAPAVSAM